MADVQGNYQQYHDKWQVGMIPDMRPKSVASYTYEGATPLAFGKAVTYGADDKGVDLGGTKFAGIVVMMQTNETVDAFKQYDTIGAMKEGPIVVAPTVAVVPGDPVHFIAATGDISNTGGIAIAGAEFETTAAPGELALVFLK